MNRFLRAVVVVDQLLLKIPFWILSFANGVLFVEPRVSVNFWINDLVEFPGHTGVQFRILLGQV